MISTKKLCTKLVTLVNISLLLEYEDIFFLSWDVCRLVCEISSIHVYIGDYFSKETLK